LKNNSLPISQFGKNLVPIASFLVHQVGNCKFERFASLGDPIAWIFLEKKKFPIPLEAEKKNFHKDFPHKAPLAARELTFMV